MMNIISKIWLNSAAFFDPVQYFFNGNFWSEFLKRFGSFSHGRIVDLACGTGELRKYTEPSDYLGLDQNSGYIALAQKRFPLKNTRFEVGDILKQGYTDNPDTIFLISAAHHLADDQISLLAKNLKQSRIKRFILVDGYPIGSFALPLAFLDAYLGGGKYFRNDQQLVALIKPHLKVTDSGEFSAQASFYRYPYLVATTINP